MSIQSQAQELDVNVEELVGQVVRDTFPGPDNERIEDGMVNALGVFPVVVQDLNDWFYAVDLRVYDEDHIGIPMRYRWTIIRWAHNDMDHWLEKNGWTDAPHRNADSRTRRNDELEARYRKEYAGVQVDCNFLVHIPEVVFDKLNEKSNKSMKKRRMEQESKTNSLEEGMEARRG
jgi:hypothetical protein